MISATRGLGFDLMSTDVDGVLDLVTSRSEGTVQYVQRYLDGDIQTQERESTCEVTRGYEQFIEYGEIREHAIQMFSSCISHDGQFVDLFSCR